MEDDILFFTATILNWNSLLENDFYKQIVISSLKFLTEKERIYLYGFVIMPTHIHLLWKIREPHLLKDVQRDFLKFTAHNFKYDLVKSHPELLSKFEKPSADRNYQFWKRKSYNNIIYGREMLEQKLEYIHNNPVQKKWKLANKPEEYYFSSARYYLLNIDDWGFITHYMEHI